MASILFPDFWCRPLRATLVPVESKVTSLYPAGKETIGDRLDRPGSVPRRDAAARLAAKERLFQVDHGEGPIQSRQQARGSHLPVLRSCSDADDDRTDTPSPTRIGTLLATCTRCLSRTAKADAFVGGAR